VSEIAVLGAGNGGQATAAHLTLEGHRVRLYDRFATATQPFAGSRQIVIRGAISGTAVVAEVTNDIGRAVTDADLILVTVPGFALAWLAEAMAPHLKSGQTVILHPGATGGALEVRQLWEAAGVAVDVTLAETETLVYACRAGAPGEPDVKAVKKTVSLAALPADRLESAFALFAELYPQAVRTSSVLATSLSNMNAVVHPAVALLNATWIDSRVAGFDFYRDGVTAGVARVLHAVDDERRAVAGALGVPHCSYMAWFESHYGVSAPDAVSLFKRLAATVYQGIGTPASLEGRYISEDVPMALVPMEALAGVVGVPTPTISAIISLASTVTGVEYRASGRTLERLGLAGLGPSEIAAFVGGVSESAHA
jgi:opine dehydrogenase